MMIQPVSTVRFGNGAEQVATEPLVQKPAPNPIVVDATAWTGEVPSEKKAGATFLQQIAMELRALLGDPVAKAKIAAQFEHLPNLGQPPQKTDSVG